MSQSHSRSASSSVISDNDVSGRDLDASMQDMDEADDPMTEDDREEDEE